MSQSINLVVVSGSPYRPSRTGTLLAALGDSLASALSVRTRVIDVADLVSDIGTALSRDQLSTKADNALRAIEQADVLLVGAPVFRGSVPGLFKHLFDLVAVDALIGKPVLLAATGGSARHALVIDHQLRPLFSFFQSLVLPTGVYACPEDFTDYQITDPALKARIALVVGQALPIIAGLFPQASLGAPESLAA